MEVELIVTFLSCQGYEKANGGTLGRIQQLFNKLEGYQVHFSKTPACKVNRDVMMRMIKRTDFIPWKVNWSTSGWDADQSIWVGDFRLLFKIIRNLIKLVHEHEKKEKFSTFQNLRVCVIEDDSNCGKEIVEFFYICRNLFK